MEGVSAAPSLGDLVRYYRGIAWKIGLINDNAIAHSERLPVRIELAADWMENGLPMFDAAWEGLPRDRETIFDARGAIANAIMRGANGDVAVVEKAMRELGTMPVDKRTEAHLENIFPRGEEGIDGELCAIARLIAAAAPSPERTKIARQFYKDSPSRDALAKSALARIRKLESDTPPRLLLPKKRTGAHRVSG